MATTTQLKPTIIAKPGETAIKIPTATVEQIQALTKLRAQAVIMIQQLETGAGCNSAGQTLRSALQVRAFQSLWNGQLTPLRPLFNSVGISVTTLAVDGKFGPNTSAATWLCLIDNTGLVWGQFPTHACDMSLPAKEPLLDAMVARLQLRLVQALAPKSKAAPAAGATPSKPVAPTPVAKPGAGAQSSAADSVAQGQGGGTAIDIGPAQDITFTPDETTPVAGTTSNALSGWIYAGIGVAVFGAGYVWWRLGKRK